MEKFLRGPSVVLVVSGVEATRADVAATVADRSFAPTATKAEVLEADGTDTDVTVTATTASSVDEAVEALAGDERIGCVVVDAALGTDAVADLLDTVGERWPEMSVLVLDGALEGDVAERVATAPVAATYLPATVDDDTLGTAIETALERHDRQYRHATESDMFDAVLRNHETSIYVKDENARHLKMADVSGGPDPEEAIGKTDHDLYAETWEEPEETLADDRAVIEDGEEVWDRQEEWGDDELVNCFRTTKLPWRPDRPGRGLTGITYEVTALRTRIEELETANERLDEFTDFVSHDLRNPLNVAAGSVDLARETGDESYLDRAADSLSRMDEMLDDITTLVKDGKGGAGSEGIVDLVPLVEATWEHLETHDATLDITLPPETTVESSEVTLQPLFENLFKNAITHGGEDVTVTVGRTPDGFYVADDGPGIPETEREDVFEDGFTTDPDGTGTGLTIVSEIADSNGWTVAVTESDEGGARFEFGNCLLVTDPVQRVSTADRLDLADSVDVGDMAVAGSAERTDSGGWRVESAGQDIWRDINEFHFVYTEVSGPVRIQARLDSFDAPAQYSKAGVMVRQSLAEDAVQGYVGGIKARRGEALWRTEPDTPTRSQQFGKENAYEWFRLDRMGDQVTLSVSGDGTTWEAVDQRDVPLSDPVYVGLACSSAMHSEPATAVFEDVVVSRLEPLE